MWLRDTGILNKLKYDVMNPPMPIPPPNVRHNQPLILGQLGITMISIAVGLFIAILVFLGELWLKRKNKMENPYNGPSAIMVQVETNLWLSGPGGHP